MTNLEALLSRWAAWMRASDILLGYPDHSAMLASGGASEDFEALYARHVESPEVEAVDAAIRSLERTQGQAIHSVWLGERWPFAAFGRDDCYELAVVALEVALHRRGVAL